MLMFGQWFQIGNCALFRLMTNTFKRVYRPWLYPQWMWRMSSLCAESEDLMLRMGEIAKKVLFEIITKSSTI